MSKSMKWVSFAIATLLAVPAFAQDTKPAPPPPPTDDQAPKEAPPPAVDAPDGAAAELKAGTGIDKKKREVVGEAESFSAGRVWVWSSITGAKGTTVKHVWKRGDKVLWEKTFEAKSNRYRTWTRRNVKAGEYTVEVQTEDGAVLGTITITVT
jgi:hypothetical protein